MTSSSWSRLLTTSSLPRDELKPKSEEPSRPGERLQASSSLDLTTKQVEVYVYTESNGVHEVAMIFEFPKSKEDPT